ncbi:MAG: glycosyl hydrolase-related protein [Spirochaetaceae bacterium]
MIVNRKTILKLNRILSIYSKNIFSAIDELELEFTKTFEHFRSCPTKDITWQPLKKNYKWGEAWQTMWLKTSFTVPADINSDKLYIKVDSGAVEVLLIVDNEYKGIFNIEREEGVRGIHHTRLMLKNPKPGESHNIALECYAGHPCVGTMPDDAREEKAFDPETFIRTFNNVTVCTKNQNIMGFVTELRILLQIAEQTGKDSFRGASIYKVLEGVFKTVPMQPTDYSKIEIEGFINIARTMMKPLLEMKNADSAPYVGMMGHSHMDTAWLWTVDETKRKCARTFSNTLNMMDEYPDYMFLQSAPLHLEMMEKEYPSIFEGIKKRIEEGRWEPNGGSWIEPDCNIPSGESFTRHFLYGQRYLKEKFDYRADTFWQPDVFGYSASIPQILKQCGIKNFLTTKLSWNEDNKFPYDTFNWSGIDGTSVFTHFNTTHNWTDPESLISQTEVIQHKDLQDGRFCAFGYGDGGGGPQFEMLEIAPYMKNIDSVPKTDYMTVSSFMDKLNNNGNEFPTWNGELYLELHRGTLTSFHKIKRLNRQAETLLRETEFLYSSMSVSNIEIKYPAKRIEELWKIVLLNQFHDILPGTSIPEVNIKAQQELEDCIKDIKELMGELEQQSGSGDIENYHVWNSWNWDRENNLQLSNIPTDLSPTDDTLEWQKTKTIEGKNKILINGFKLPSLSSKSISFKKDENKNSNKRSFYTYKNNTLETNLYTLKFSQFGAIESLIDIEADRELVAPGGLFNNIMFGEDIPALWDNWDIDVDQHMKMSALQPDQSWEIIEEGPLQIKLANKFKAGLTSYIDQHIIIYRDSKQIDFETVVDWKEDHKLLKTEFDLDIQVDKAKYEIQYGHLERFTHTNSPQDRSQFEVCNHQWSDLSEPNYGVALLNDCKYGVSNVGSKIGLSLLKSGTHPDPSADRGIHVFTYSLLPHNCSFSTKSVIRPARELNTPLTVFKSESTQETFNSLFEIDKENILLEAIKQSEDGTGSIIRLFETEKSKTTCTIKFSNKPVKVYLCNMLEEIEEEIEVDNNSVIALNFHGFGIRSLKVIW